MRIGSNVTIKGSVSLGNDVCIESNVVLVNTKIGDNSTVKDFCSIEDSSLAKNVEVGPFARLRNGAVLDDSAKIGNFVEIKKSKIGEGPRQFLIFLFLQNFQFLLNHLKQHHFLV